MVKIEKKKRKEKKDGYPKLIVFKVWILNCKNDKISAVISEVFLNIKLTSPPL
jgi:hypothetical protein